MDADTTAWLDHQGALLAADLRQLEALTTVVEQTCGVDADEARRRARNVQDIMAAATELIRQRVNAHIRQIVGAP